MLIHGNNVLILEHDYLFKIFKPAALSANLLECAGLIVVAPELLYLLLNTAPLSVRVSYFSY